MSNTAVRRFDVPRVSNRVRAPDYGLREELSQVAFPEPAVRSPAARISPDGPRASDPTPREKRPRRRQRVAGSAPADLPSRYPPAGSTCRQVVHRVRRNRWLVTSQHHSNIGSQPRNNEITKFKT